MAKQKVLIKKVKILTEDTKIEWLTPYKDGGYNSAKINSKNEPSESFKKAVADLKPYLSDLCEMNKEDQKLIKSTGVSLAYKGDDNDMFVTLYGYKNFKNSPGCMTFNSAQKATVKKEGEETATENLLDEKAVAIVKKVIAEAVNFINGERLQVEMDIK